LLLSLAVLGVLAAGSWSVADTIAIDNPSFEQDGVQVDVPSWVDVDMTPESPIDSPYSVYQSGPNAANYYPVGDLDGDYFLLVDGYQAGFYAYQDTGATFVPGNLYTLTVAVGRRADHDELAWPDTPWMFSLNYADDGTEVASLSGSIPNGGGGVMTDQSLVYVAQAGDAGKEIRVLIGRAAADPWAGQSTGYDNVRLDVVPEPSGFALIVAGLLAFVVFGRRKGC
jgi:hypothetical protein